MLDELNTQSYSSRAVSTLPGLFTTPYLFIGRHHFETSQPTLHRQSVPVGGGPDGGH